MKTIKSLILLILVLLSINSFSQVKVDANGNAIIGANHNETYDDSWGSLFISENGADNGITFYTHNSTTFRMWRGTSNNGEFGYITRGTNNFSLVFDPYGNVGAGMEPYSGYRFSVNGKIRCTSVYETSDISLKMNVKKYNPNLTYIDSLQPISYNYKISNKNKLPDEISSNEIIDMTDSIDDQISVGFSAQEVKKYFPELVRMDDDSLLAINYSGFIPILWQSNQELRKEINQIKSQQNISVNNISTITNSTKEDFVIFNPSKKNQKNVEAYIMDLMGNLITIYSQSENGKIIVNSLSLSPGMYKCSIIENGELSRMQMIMITL